MSRQRIAAITSTLQTNLESAFQEGLQTGELDILSRVLRTYAIIDKTHDAELLFKEMVVKPYMSEVQLLENTVIINHYHQDWYSPLYSGRLEYIGVHCCTVVHSYAVHFIVHLSTLCVQLRG